MAADIGGQIGQIASQTASGLGTTGLYIMYIAIVVVLFVIVGALAWWYYSKKGFNVTVVILRPRAGTNVFDYEGGATGRHYYDRTSKERRFEIQKAKKLGILYNNEAIDQKYFIKRFVKGKVNPMVFMAPDNEGWYHPIMMSLDSVKGLLGSVENADLSYFGTELELMDAMFNKKSFLERYYLLVLIFLMIIVVCIQWYSAAQIHKAAQLNLQQAQIWQQVMDKLIAQIGTNQTVASQVIKVG